MHWYKYIPQGVFASVLNQYQHNLQGEIKQVYIIHSKDVLDLKRHICKYTTLQGERSAENNVRKCNRLSNKLGLYVLFSEKNTFLTR